MTSSSFSSFIQRERTTLIVAFALGCVAVLLYLFLAFQPTYQSSAKLLVKNIARGNVITEYGDDKPLSSESGYSNPLFNYQEILRSEILARQSYPLIKEQYPKMLSDLKVKTEEQWVKKFPQLVKTKVVPSTDVIQLTFNWVDEESADDVTSIVLNSFKESNLQILRGVTLQQRRYLDDQLKVVSDELLQVRKAIRQYKEQNQAIDLTGETSRLVQDRMSLEQQLAVLKAQRTQNLQKAEELSDLLGVQTAKQAVLASGIGTDPFLQDQQNKLAALQEEYQGLSAKYTDEHPTMKTLNQQISSVKAAISARRNEVLSNGSVKKGLYTQSSSDIATDLARVQAEATSQEAQIGELTREINAIRARESSIPRKQLGMDELTKKESALAAAYDNIKKKQLETRIKENAIVDNVVFLADPSEGKLNLKEPLIAIVGLLAFALGLGFAFAWIKEGFNDRWNDPIEVEQATNKPVLGTIPWTPLPKGESSIQLTQRVLMDDATTTRAYDSIANRIMHRSFLDNTQVISFCSLSGQRTSSAITSQVAYALAKAGRRVVLIDADLERPLRHLNFFECPKPESYHGLVETITDFNRRLRDQGYTNGNTQNGKGLRAAMPDEQVAAMLSPSLIHVELEHKLDNQQVMIDYLTASSPLSRPSDVLASHGFHRLVQYLKETYEFVIIDAAAAPMDFPEVQAVMNRTEGVVLVAPLESKRENLLREITRLESENTNTFGILMRDK